MYYVYILRSQKTGDFYKGLTNNIKKRIQEHVSGQSPTTKTQLPLELIHVETCETLTEARQLEKYFKSGYGREIISEIACSQRQAEVAEW